MIAVIYDRSGLILQSIEGSEEAAQLTAAAMEMEYLEVSEADLSRQTIDEFDMTHKVVNGELVAI